MRSIFADNANMVSFSAPLLGLDRAVSSLDRTASKVARLGFSGDSLDLGPEMVALIEARRSFEANTKVVKVEDEMTRSALNIVA